MRQSIKSVFLIEDEPEIARWIKDKIEEAGKLSLVKWLDRLTGAYDQIKKSSPDVLILDLKFPDGNGIDLLKRMRNNGINIIVIILSVNNMAKDACLRLGADYFFDKASETDLFVDRISAL
jgi:DNA-binding response OmpR family regulator